MLFAKINLDSDFQIFQIWNLTDQLCISNSAAPCQHFYCMVVFDGLKKVKSLSHVQLFATLLHNMH